MDHNTAIEEKLNTVLLNALHDVMSHYDIPLIKPANILPDRTLTIFLYSILHKGCFYHVAPNFSILFSEKHDFNYHTAQPTTLYKLEKEVKWLNFTSSNKVTDEIRFWSKPIFKQLHKFFSEIYLDNNGVVLYMLPFEVYVEPTINGVAVYVSKLPTFRDLRFHQSGTDTPHDRILKKWAEKTHNEDLF